MVFVIITADKKSIVLMYHVYTCSFANTCIEPHPQQHGRIVRRVFGADVAEEMVAAQVQFTRTQIDRKEAVKKSSLC